MHCADMVNISQKYQRGPYESHQSYRFLAVVNGLDERGGSCGSRALIATLRPSHKISTIWHINDLTQPHTPVTPPSHQLQRLERPSRIPVLKMI